MRLDTEKSVSDIVRGDYRTADVFKKYGINYCCGGQLPLKEACNLKGVLYADVLAELQKAVSNHGLSILEIEQWKTDFLVDYIINVHHAYLDKVLPTLEVAILTFANSHKKTYPELEEILKRFSKLAELLLKSNRYEEEIIFPYVKQIESAHRRNESYGHLLVRTLRKPLTNVEEEFRKMQAALSEIADLTNEYTYPEKACTNHRVIFSKLRELDVNIGQHKYLEDLLFKRAIAIEKVLLDKKSMIPLQEYGTSHTGVY